LYFSWKLLKILPFETCSILRPASFRRLWWQGAVYFLIGEGHFCLISER
jgi:hypothetical protein